MRRKERILPGLVAGAEHGLWVQHARLVLASGFGLTCVALIAAVFIAMRASEADRLVTRTFEAREEATLLLGDLQNAETGQRGFLLTSDQRYLEPFQNAVDSIGPRLTRLATLSSASGEQQARIHDVKTLVDAKLDELRQTIALSRQGQHDEALAIVRSDRGKQLMDALQAEFIAISKAE